MTKQNTYDMGGQTLELSTLSLGHANPQSAGNGIVIGDNIDAGNGVTLGNAVTSMATIPDTASTEDSIFAPHITQVMTHSIRILSADGTPYYIMVTDANTNRTEA